MEEKDNLFQKGFNSGYLIAKHNPELLEKIVKNPNPSSDFYQGVLGGQKEFDREKKLLLLHTKSSAKTELTKDQNKLKSPNKSNFKER